MGSNSSKSNIDTTVHSIKNNLDNDNPDPRSPTPEISRTPLNNKSTSKHNITKNVDLRKTFESTKNSEEKLIHNNPILSAVIKNHLQSYDPRSPTLDFERTPIIIASKIDELHNDKKISRLNTENHSSPMLKQDADEGCDSCTEANEHSPNVVVPKNLCNGFFDLTLNDTLKDAEEPLGSSTASNDAIENNISSDVNPTKYLETNFDYVEAKEDNFEDSEDHAENIDIHNNSEICNTIPLFKILTNDPRSPSVGIERTPIVVTKHDEDTSEDNVEEMSDDTLIKVLQNTNAELRLTVSKPHDKNGEGLLVYEDESTPINNETPKKSKSTSNSGCRTPLSCMKNITDAGHARSKSANTVLDPKEQKVVLSKIPKRVSHIPRLKILTKHTKLPPAGSTVSLKNMSRTAAVSGDCENTPPHSHRDIWDKDNSIVL